MHEFLNILPKILAKKRALNTASDEKEKPDDSKKISAKLDSHNEDYLELVKSLCDIEMQCKEDKELKNTISKKTKKAIADTDVKIHSIFTNIECEMKDLKDTYCDGTLLLAIKLLVDIYYVYIPDEASKAEELCRMNMKFVKGRELSPKYIILAIVTQLQLNHILYAKKAPIQERYSCLIKAMVLYCTYTAKEPYPIPTAYDLSDKSEMNPCVVLDFVHITTLNELINIYILYPHEKDDFIIYMHKLLKGTMEEALLQLGHLEWSITCANLVFYFIYHDRFREAKSHLLIASKIAINYEKTIMNTIETDKISDLEIDLYVHRCGSAIHAINIIWMQYAIELIRTSHERLLPGEKISTNNSPCEADNSSLAAPLLFDETSSVPVVLRYEDETIIDYCSFTDQYLINYDDVSKLYNLMMPMINKTTEYFRLENNTYRLGESSLYISRLYKYMSYFDGNFLIKDWHKDRIVLLDDTTKLLNDSTDLSVKRLRPTVYLELSLAYCAALDNAEEMAVQTGEDLSEETTESHNNSVKNIITSFTFFKIYHDELKSLYEERDEEDE